MIKQIKFFAAMSIVLMSFSTSMIAQIEIVNEEPLEIKNILDWEHTYEVEIKNLTDTIVLFHWRYNVPEEIEEMVLVSLKDLNVCYTSIIRSTCDEASPNFPNELQVLPNGLIFPTFMVQQVVPVELEHFIDSISLDLLRYPDCDSIYHTIEIFNGDLSSTIDMNQQQLKIFPNPVKEIIYFEDSDSQIGDYAIYNIAGVLLQKGTTNFNKIELDFMDKGILILKYINDEIVFSKKIIRL